MQRQAFDEAERLCLRALRDDDADPIQSAKMLGIVYGRVGRHFECMLMARCALRRARAVGDRAQEAGSLGVLCTSLSNIPALSRLAEPIAQLGALLEQFDDPRAWRMHRSAAFALALHEQRIGDAENLLGEIEERIRAAPLRPNEDAMLRFFEMRLAKARGDSEAHMALLDAIVGEQDDNHPERLPFLLQRAVAQAKRGAIHDATASARQALQLLHEGQDLAFMSEMRASEGARLGRFFWDALGDAPHAHEAFDLVTAAMLNRMLQVDTAVGNLEAAGVLDGADEAVLEDMRRDFMDALVRMLREVSTIQRQAANSGLAAHVFDDTDIDDALRVCAWCDSVQVPGQIWLPLGQFAPRTRAAQVTHGMCESCYQRERAAYA